MVRLKGTAFNNFSDQKFISIPYGAIKRVCGKISNNLEIIFQFLMVRLKETLNLDFTAEEEKFQFLMVRLKDFNKRNKGRNKNISIPYGAIKS